MASKLFNAGLGLLLIGMAAIAVYAFVTQQYLALAALIPCAIVFASLLDDVGGGNLSLFAFIIFAVSVIIMSLAFVGRDYPAFFALLALNVYMCAMFMLKMELESTRESTVPYL